jgi:hypothetical protein
MATYTVTFKQLLDNYAVLQTLTDTEIEVGQSITVASVAAPFNGTFVVYAMPKYEYIGIDTEGDLLFNSNVSIPNQVLFACTGDDVGRIASAGTITYTQNCTWITTAQLVTYLGVDITNPSDDYTLATQAANASSTFCYRRRRQESGYFDNLSDFSPGHDVTLGTLMYAAALWRAVALCRTLLPHSMAWVQRPSVP